MDTGLSCLFVAAYAAAVAFALAVVVRLRPTIPRNQWHEALSWLATRYPISVETTGPGLGKATGETPEGKLVVDLFHEMGGESPRPFTRVRLTPLTPPLSSSLSISAEGLVSKLAKVAGVEDLRTGDPPFDDAALLHGSSSELRARLSHDARRLLLPAVLAGLRIEKGTIELRRPGLTRDRRELDRIVQTVLDVAHVLRIDDVASALYENASHDPEAGVRLECASELVQMGAATPERMRPWLAQGDLRLKLIAAQQLGDDGFDALCELANPKTTVGQEALHTLASLFCDRAAPTLRRHEEALRTEIAGIPARVERKGIFAPNPNELTDQIRLLGAIGTIDSVETLMMPHLPRDAARIAIRAIQARIPGAEAGRLAIVDSAGGELSDVPDEGRVTLADPTRTRTTR